MRLVEARLLHGGEAHQDEVADQVGLTQCAAGRVHALKDELWVVLITTEGDIHDHELCEPCAQRREVGPNRLHTLLKEGKVFRDAERGLGRLRLLLHQGEQALLVRLGEEELEATLAVFQRVEEIVAADLFRRKPIHELPVTHAPRQGFENEHHRRQALLAVDDEQRRLAGDLIEPLFDVDNGADEVGRDGVVAARSQDVIPELTALALRPAIGALVDRDHKLRRSFQEFDELGFGGLHDALPLMISPSNPEVSFSSARMSARISSSVRSGCGL